MASPTAVDNVVSNAPTPNPLLQKIMWLAMAPPSAAVDMGLAMAPPSAAVDMGLAMAPPCCSRYGVSNTNNAPPPAAVDMGLAMSPSLLQ